MKFGPKWNKLDFGGDRKCSNLMVDAVGIEPTTCRLRAVRFVLAPATTGCYKVLSIVWFTSSLHAALTIGTPQIMTDFEGAWVQKWVQSFGVTSSVETN